MECLKNISEKAQIKIFRKLIFLPNLLNLFVTDVETLDEILDVLAEQPAQQDIISKNRVS